MTAPTDDLDALASELPPVGSQLSLPTYLSEIWNRREFVTFLPFSVLRAQNRDSVLGNVWHLINPILQVLVYYVIFGVILGTTRGVDNFIAFLTIGVFTFGYSQKSLTDGSRSLTRNEGLIKSIQFPRAILPLSSIAGQGMAFVFSLLVMLGTSLFTGETPALRWLILVPVIGLQTVFNLGGSFLLARMAFQVRDVQQILPHAFRLLFYTSGVMFSIDAFVTSEFWRRAFDLNPFFAFVNLTRWAILGMDVHWLAVTSSLVWAFGSLLIGFAYFRTAETTYGRS